MAKPRCRCLSLQLAVLCLVLISMMNMAWLPPKIASAFQADQPEPPRLPMILHLHPLLGSAMKVAAGGPLPCLASIAPPLCYSPQQIRQAYDIEPLVKGGIRGQGR